jgi:hypothetical protein
MQRLSAPVTDVAAVPCSGQQGDGQQGDRTALRASDDDRQRVLALLQTHFVDGRLDQTELEQRIERTLAARTWGDLDQQLADLPRLDPAPVRQDPPPVPPPLPQRYPRRHRAGSFGQKSFAAHVSSYGLVMVMLVAIWLLTSPGHYFWPIWPMLGWGLPLAWHGLMVRVLSGPRREPS